MFKYSPKKTLSMPISLMNYIINESEPEIPECQSFPIEEKREIEPDEELNFDLDLAY